ncbi:MAG: CehA/McbA family metallohydrolase [Planctomyces sp.]|nr:CehA/McbA family metallohydrolase [Planctomyces sp.]
MPSCSWSNTFAPFSLQKACLCLAFSALVLLPASTVIGGQPQEVPPTIEVLSPENWEILVPKGKEVDAIYGDFVLRNAHFTAVIAQPIESRNANMTVRNVGGCLIDLTANHHPGDQLSAWYPGRRKQTFRNPQHTTSSDGRVSLTMEAAGSETLPACSIQWSLGPQDHSLQLTTTWKNTSEKDLTFSLEDDVRADGGKEEMLKSPDGEAAVFTIHDTYWEQAYGWRSPGYRIRSNSNARESVLVYESESQKSVTLTPGESFTHARSIFVARDLVELRAVMDHSIRAEAGQPAMFSSPQVESWGPEVRVLDASGKSVEVGKLKFRQGDEFAGSRRLERRPVSHLPLKPGTWEMTYTYAGKDYGSQPLVISEESSSGQQSVIELKFSEFQPGKAIISIVDGDNKPIPAKVEFLGRGETAKPNFGPESAEYLVGNLAYTASGRVETILQQGQYDLIISHGPEYDAEFTRVQIESGKTAELKVVLKRVVNTEGWVSADFHSHSSPSGDNTSSQLGRVLNLAAEHIEFAPCTEHNRVSSYSDHIAFLGLSQHLATVSGMELTGSPLPLNHQNVFPMIHRPRTQDGGGPTTDASPETQMERIVAWDDHSEKLIQQNHPDLGWLFYDKNGDQQPDEGYSRSFPLMNVMEVHPIDPILNLQPMYSYDGKVVGNQTIFNWLQLLNQGYRIYGVVNTDSHYNFHGSGGLRLWLKSLTDEPGSISSDEMRDVARSGKIVMSNGPFLDVHFSGPLNSSLPSIPGEDFSARDGRVRASIRVESPNWIEIDTVFVLVNGRRRDDLVFTAESHPEYFAKGSVKFSQTLDFEIKEDSHLIVVAGHRTATLGDVAGPFWGTQHPAAVTNPVFVDVNDGMFTSSKDTLDAKLPVKFIAPK